MKITVHVPTEQYGFASAEVDSTEVKGKTLGAFTKELYEDISNAFKPELTGKGLDKQEWRDFLDEYIWNGGGINDEILNKMNDYQKNVYQDLKRSKVRNEKM